MAEPFDWQCAEAAVASSMAEDIKSGHPRWDMPADARLFLDEVEAKGEGPFEEQPPAARTRAAWRVRAATGRRIRVRDDCSAMPRRRVLTRPRGAGRPRARRTSRNTRAGPSREDPSDSEPGEAARRATDDDVAQAGAA